MNWSEVLTVGPIVVVHCYAMGIAAAVAGFLSRREWLNRVALGFLGLTFFVHVLLLGHAFIGASSISLPVYVSLMAWCVMLVGLISSMQHKQILLVMLSPVALVVYLAGLLMEPAPLPSVLSGMFSVIHVGALFGAMALLALAFGAGVLFLLQERRIKAKARLSALSRDIPALNVLDRINALAVVVGFPLFTVGLFSGFVGARVAYGQLMIGEIKELFSLAVWALFAFLYHQRLTQGWQGRKTALLAMVIFAFCVFSLTVVNVFMTTHHGISQ